jgi:hypothetical protein
MQQQVDFSRKKDFYKNEHYDNADGDWQRQNILLCNFK